MRFNAAKRFIRNRFKALIHASAMSDGKRMYPTFPMVVIVHREFLPIPGVEKPGVEKPSVENSHLMSSNNSGRLFRTGDIQRVRT
jgi:hypothetical protein